MKGLTSLQIGILKRYPNDTDNGVIWRDEYISWTPKALDGLADMGYLERVYTATNRIGFRITSMGRRIVT